MSQLNSMQLADAVGERLMETLFSAGHTGELSAFDRARFLRDIESVAKVDAQASYLLRAIVATLDGDIDEAVRATDGARLLKSEHAASQLLYSLSNLGYARRAQALAKSEMRPGVPLLSQLIRAAVPSGVVVTATQAIDAAQEMGVVLASVANAAIDTARRAERALKLAGRSEDELVAILDVAGEALRERRLLWLDRCPHVIALTGQESDDCEPGVHYVYRLDVSPTEAAALTSEVGWRLVDRDADRVGLSVAFVGSKMDAIAA